MNEELKAKLVELGFKEDQIGKLAEDLGVETEDDLAAITEKDLIGIGLKPVPARKMIAKLNPKPPEPEKPAGTPVPSNSAPSISMDILPHAPDDASFLASLKVGGELRIGTTEMISAVRAALADKTKLYDLPKMILERMRTFAEEQELPVNAEYYKLRGLLVRHTYSEIFAALEIDGASVTQESKNALLKKLRARLWTAFFSFNDQLSKFITMWKDTNGNPALLAASFSAIVTGTPNPAAGMMMQFPDTSSLHDAAEGVINEINKVFAGEGIVISRALAYDANKIKEVLENPDLPAQVGSTSRDQMLKSLGVDVSADYVRLERNLVRFAISIIEYSKVTPGQEEMFYLNALSQLGSVIPWDKLIEGGRPGAGSSFPKDKDSKPY